MSLDMKDNLESKFHEYVESGGDHCPYCESGSIQGESLEVSGGQVTQKVWCCDCEAEWQDSYLLNKAIEIKKGSVSTYEVEIQTKAFVRAKLPIQASSLSEARVKAQEMIDNSDDEIHDVLWSYEHLSEMADVTVVG